MFNMKFVSRVTGINQHTIRAWEKRFALIYPERTDLGRRLYSEKDIQKLKLVKALVDSGKYKISELANYSLADLELRSNQLKAAKVKTHYKFKLELNIVDLAIQTKNLSIIENEFTKKIDMALDDELAIDNVIFDFIIPVYTKILRQGLINKEFLSFEDIILRFLTNQIMRLYRYSKRKQIGDDICHLPLLIGTTGTIRGEIDSVICCILSVIRGHNAIYIGNELTAQSINFYAKNYSHRSILITDRFVSFKSRPNLFNLMSEIHQCHKWELPIMTLLHNHKTSMTPDFFPLINKQFQSFDSLEAYLQHSA